FKFAHYSLREFVVTFLLQHDLSLPPEVSIPASLKMRNSQDQLALGVSRRGRLCHRQWMLANRLVSLDDIRIFDLCFAVTSFGLEHDVIHRQNTCQLAFLIDDREPANFVG